MSFLLACWSPLSHSSFLGRLFVFSVACLMAEAYRLTTNHVSNISDPTVVFSTSSLVMAVPFRIRASFAIRGRLIRDRAQILSLLLQTNVRERVYIKGSICSSS